MLYSFILFIIMIKVQIHLVISPQDIWLVDIGAIKESVVYLMNTVTIKEIIVVLKH